LKGSREKASAKRPSTHATLTARNAQKMRRDLAEEEEFSSKIDDGWNILLLLWQ
jgi:hypothetical protein